MISDHNFIIASLQLLTTFENTCGNQFYKFTLSHFREPASRATPFFLWLLRTKEKIRKKFQVENIHLKFQRNQKGRKNAELWWVGVLNRILWSERCIVLFSTWDNRLAYPNLPIFMCANAYLHKNSNLFFRINKNCGIRYSFQIDKQI